MLKRKWVVLNDDGGGNANSSVSSLGAALETQEF